MHMSKREEKYEEIKEMGTMPLQKGKHKIELLTIIGEVEGHDLVSNNTKATKYDHILPKLAEIEESEDIFIVALFAGITPLLIITVSSRSIKRNARQLKRA